MSDLPREILPSQIRYGSGGAVEEILNGLSHAIGAGLSIAGLVVLLVISSEDPTPWKYVSFSIYGASQILLFLSSAFMHSFAAFPRVRRALLVFDRAFIFVLIAGTYTPIALILMRGNGGWLVFGIIWGLALVGVVVKAVLYREDKLVTDLVYLPMGWLVVVFFRQVLESTPPELILWMVIGGVSYTVGVVFYAWQKLPFGHVVWHLFVLAGSISFFLGFALHLA